MVEAAKFLNDIDQQSLRELDAKLRPDICKLTTADVELFNSVYSRLDFMKQWNGVKLRLRIKMGSITVKNSEFDLSQILIFDDNFDQNRFVLFMAKSRSLLINKSDSIRLESDNLEDYFLLLAFGVIKIALILLKSLFWKYFLIHKPVSKIIDIESILEKDYFLFSYILTKVILSLEFDIWIFETYLYSKYVQMRCQYFSTLLLPFLDFV